MKKGLFIALLLLSSAVIPAVAQDAAAAKTRAYELYQAKRFNEAAQQFKAYFDTNPDDPAAMIDYASLLSELARHEDAAKLLETIHQKALENETAAFKLAVEYAALKRYADAEKLFAELEKSNNPAIASAAADSSQKATADQRRDARFKAEQHVGTRHHVGQRSLTIWPISSSIKTSSTRWVNWKKNRSPSPSPCKCSGYTVCRASINTPWHSTAPTN